MDLSWFIPSASSETWTNVQAVFRFQVSDGEEPDSPFVTTVARDG